MNSGKLRTLNGVPTTKPTTPANSKPTSNVGATLRLDRRKKNAAAVPTPASAPGYFAEAASPAKSPERMSVRARPERQAETDRRSDTDARKVVSTSGVA